MHGIGTIVNAGAIIACSLLGLTVKKGLPEKMKTSLIDAMGIAVAFIGISGTLSASFHAQASGVISSGGILLLILSLVIGTVIGELLKLDILFERVGNALGARLSRGSGTNFSYGFVNATIIFCVGAMAIVGSIQDGLAGDPTTLYAKSVLDGIMSFILASAYGAGVMLSAVAVFLYQGAITVCAVFFKQFATDALMSQTSMVGSALIFCIGINMLGIKKINVANMLPAAFIPMIYAMIRGLLKI
ncbi:MAG: DUF554 domain-containing protein [Bacillota bacterium]|nr:DUF554 domain-containing protein [Bacillota bacterium]